MLTPSLLALLWEVSGGCGLGFFSMDCLDCLGCSRMDHSHFVSISGNRMICQFFNVSVTKSLPNIFHLLSSHRTQIQGEETQASSPGRSVKGFGDNVFQTLENGCSCLLSPVCQESCFPLYVDCLISFSPVSLEGDAVEEKDPPLS